MKYLIALMALLGPTYAMAARPDPVPADSICLEWEAPTENDDGTPLLDLDGFEVFWAFTPGDWVAARSIDIPDENQTQLSTPSTPIDIPSPGPGGGDVDVYFSMRAYDSSGVRSDFSNQVASVVSFPDTQPPGSPRILNVIISVTTG